PYYASYYRAEFSPNLSYQYIVEQNKKLGVMDTSGKMIVPLIYKNITINEDSSILVWNKKDGYSLYSFTGQKSPLQFDSYFTPEYLGGHLYKVTKRVPRIEKKKYSFRFYIPIRMGVIDAMGNEVLPTEFTEIILLKSDTVLVAA